MKYLPVIIVFFFLSGTVYAQTEDRVILDLMIYQSDSVPFVNDTVKVIYWYDHRKIVSVAKNLQHNQYEIQLPRELYGWIGVQCRRYTGSLRCVDNKNGLIKNKLLRVSLEASDYDYIAAKQIFSPPCVQRE